MKIADPYSYINQIIKRRKRSTSLFATFLCVLLDDAEELFGPRVEPYPYMFAGFNFDGESDYTVAWGEGTDIGHSKYILIQISKAGLRDTSAALWALIHECIHLISPKQDGATYFEEGLAIWYQRRWLQKCPDIMPKRVRNSSMGIHDCYGSYLDALALVDLLLSVDETSVKRIRTIEPAINKLTTEIIMEGAPWIDKKTAACLLKKFCKSKRSIKTVEHLKLLSNSKSL